MTVFTNIEHITGEIELSFVVLLVGIRHAVEQITRIFSTRSGVY